MIPANPRVDDTPRERRKATQAAARKAATVERASGAVTLHGLASTAPIASAENALPTGVIGDKCQQCGKRFSMVGRSPQVGICAMCYGERMSV